MTNPPVPRPGGSGFVDGTRRADPTSPASLSSVPAQLHGRELDARRSWSQRHRARLDRIFGVRDPWLVPGDWTDREVDAWQAAAEHLACHELYGRWQVPDSVRVAWYRRRCRCSTGAA